MASVNKRTWMQGGVAREAWQVRYQNAGGGWQRRQFGNKRDAFAFVRELKAEAERAAAPKTFVDLYNDYLRLAERRHNEGRLGLGRMQELRSSFRNWVTPFFGGKLAEAITEADVEGYHDNILRAGTMNRRSARVHLAILQLVEAEANKRGHMLERPVWRATRGLRGYAVVPIRTFTIDEVRRLIALAPVRTSNGHERAAAKLACFVNVAAFCGLRAGEIAGLTIDSIRFDERVLQVRNAVSRARTLKGPKTRSGIRDVPLPPAVAHLLREWLDRHYRPNPSRLVFAGRDGGPMNMGTIYELWSNLLMRAGLDDGGKSLHFHALRHFYASMMIEAGTPLPDAAILLGHKTFDMTLRTYTHSVAEKPTRHAFVDRMADRFAALASPPRLAALSAPIGTDMMEGIR